jgi:dihydrofolate reductase
MINLICAMDNNNIIGKDNEMPWHLPKDLAHFKETTDGHIVVMGSKTYDSIGRDLPNRKNFVLTRRPKVFYELYPESNALAGNITDLNHLIHIYWKNEEIFVIGGANVYEQFLPYADRLYLTRIDASFEGDTYFPEVDYAKWTPIKESIRTELDNGIPLYFVTYERRAE